MLLKSEMGHFEPRDQRKLLDDLVGDLAVASELVCVCADLEKTEFLIIGRLCDGDGSCCARKRCGLKTEGGICY